MESESLSKIISGWGIDIEMLLCNVKYYIFCSIPKCSPSMSSLTRISRTCCRLTACSMASSGLTSPSSRSISISFVVKYRITFSPLHLSGSAFTACTRALQTKNGRGKLCSVSLNFNCRSGQELKFDPLHHIPFQAKSYPFSGFVSSHLSSRKRRQRNSSK